MLFCILNLKMTNLHCIPINHYHPYLDKEAGKKFTRPFIICKTNSQGGPRHAFGGINRLTVHRRTCRLGIVLSFFFGCFMPGFLGENKLFFLTLILIPTNVKTMLYCTSINSHLCSINIVLTFMQKHELHSGPSSASLELNTA